MSPHLIVVGTSLGGLAALQVLLRSLQQEFPIPIAIVQHRHKNSQGSMAAFLQRHTALKIREVEDKDEIMAGVAYLAPADYHLLVEQGYFTLSTDEPVCFARPSIDVLFESAAAAYGAQTAAVVLTGANQDGAVGATAVKAHGGIVIVQEPTTAESPVMPAATIARTQVDAVLPLAKIAARLNQWGDSAKSP